MSERVGNFIAKHAGWVLAIVLGGASWVYALGENNSANRATEAAVRKIEREGSEFAQGTRAIVEQHTKQIDELRVDAKEQRKDLSELKSDIRLVAEWVKEQKEKAK